MPICIKGVSRDDFNNLKPSSEWLLHQIAFKDNRFLVSKPILAFIEGF